MNYVVQSQNQDKILERNLLPGRLGPLKRPERPWSVFWPKNSFKKIPKRVFSLALSKISSQLCNVTFRSFVWFFVQEILVIEFSSNFTIIYLYIITPKSVCHQAHYFYPWLEIFFFNWLKQNISNIQIVWKKKMKKYKKAEKLWALNHFPISRSGRGWGTSGGAQSLSQFLN